MKNFNLLEKVITEFGFTPEEVVKNWLASGKVKLRDVESTGLKRDTPDIIGNISPGMFVYSDGLISVEIIPGKQITSVVGAIIGRRVLCVCLRETSIPWSSDFLEVDTRSISSGFEATQEILAVAKEQGKKAEAAEWCAKYARDGVKAGEAFLPSLDEWKAIQPNKKIINQALCRLKVAKLNGLHWSSTEYGSHGSWLLCMDFGGYSYDFKHNNYYVRPVLVFEL